MDYTQLTDDLIQQTDTKVSTIDLVSTIDALKDIRTSLLALPVQKTEPDQETLNVYNEWVIDQRANAQPLIDQAKAILRVLKAVYDAGELPSKYVQPLITFNNFVDSL
jgi:hypothetical protein